MLCHLAELIFDDIVTEARLIIFFYFVSAEESGPRRDRAFFSFFPKVLIEPLIWGTKIGPPLKPPCAVSRP